MNDIDFYTSKNNTLPAKRMSVDYALRLIQEGRYREYADKVRNAKTREELDRAKFDAPGFSFSGIFERRGKDRLMYTRSSSQSPERVSRYWSRCRTVLTQKDINSTTRL